MNPFILLIALFSINFLYAKEINILDFGAIPNNENYNNVIPIQNAINSLKDEGGTVIIPDGTFYLQFEKFSSIVIFDNIKIKGINSSKLKVLGNLNQRTHVLKNFDEIEGNENIEIENLTIDCSYLGEQIVYQMDNRINGITFFKSKNITIKNVEVLNGNGYGIWLSNTRYSIIEKSLVKDFGDAIELSENSSFNIIRNNEVFSTGEVNYISSFILLYGGSKYNLIYNNNLHGAAGQALSTVSYYGYGSSNLFFNNIVNCYNTVGIYIAGNNNMFLFNSIKIKDNAAILFYEGEDLHTNNVIWFNKIDIDLTNSPMNRKSAFVLNKNALNNHINFNK